jgi:uncharacterized protein YkwD
MRVRGVILFLFSLAALSACTPTPEVRTGFGYGERASAPIPLDLTAALAMMNEIRVREGEAPVRMSPALTAMAQEHADMMAATNTLSHEIGGLLTDRLLNHGYGYWSTAENIGGGYRSLEEAFYFWQESPGHRENLLMAETTEIGIANAFNMDSQYRTYWVLIMARPIQDGPYRVFPILAN